MTAASQAYKPVPLPPGTGMRERRISRLADLVGTPLRNELDVVRQVERGLSPQIIERLVDQGLTRKELAFVVPARTLTHRIQKGERLSRDESERSLRLASLLILAEQVLGQEAAAGWLRQPLRRFDGASALETAQTEQGARLVEALLLQIDEGYVA